MRTTLKQIEWNSGINKVEELLHQVLSEVADQLNLRQGSFRASTAAAAAALGDRLAMYRFFYLFYPSLVNKKPIISLWNRESHTFYSLVGLEIARSRRYFFIYEKRT